MKKIALIIFFCDIIAIMLCVAGIFAGWRLPSWIMMIWVADVLLKNIRDYRDMD